jgi:hypothetical protein
MAGIFQSASLIFFPKIMGGKVDPCSGCPREVGLSAFNVVDDFSGFTPKAVSLRVVDYENGNPVLSEPEFPAQVPKLAFGAVSIG